MSRSLRVFLFTLWVLAVGVVSLLLILEERPNVDFVSVGKVTQRQGNVRFRLEELPVWRNADLNEKLANRSVIATEANSSATFVFNRGRKIQIKENTQVLISDETVDGDLNHLVTLLKGDVELLKMEEGSNGFLDKVQGWLNENGLKSAVFSGVKRLSFGEADTFSIQRLEDDLKVQVHSGSIELKDLKSGETEVINEELVVKPKPTPTPVPSPTAVAREPIDPFLNLKGFPKLDLREQQKIWTPSFAQALSTPIIVNIDTSATKGTKYVNPIVVVRHSSLPDNKQVVIETLKKIRPSVYQAEIPLEQWRSFLDKNGSKINIFTGWKVLDSFEDKPEELMKISPKGVTTELFAMNLFKDPYFDVSFFQLEANPVYPGLWWTPSSQQLSTGFSFQLAGITQVDFQKIQKYFAFARSFKVIPSKPSANVRSLYVTSKDRMIGRLRLPQGRKVVAEELKKVCQMLSCNVIYQGQKTDFLPVQSEPDLLAASKSGSIVMLQEGKFVKFDSKLLSNLSEVRDLVLSQGGMFFRNEVKILINQ